MKKLFLMLLGFLSITTNSSAQGGFAHDITTLKFSNVAPYMDAQLFDHTVSVASEKNPVRTKETINSLFSNSETVDKEELGHLINWDHLSQIRNIDDRLKDIGKNPCKSLNCYGISFDYEKELERESELESLRYVKDLYSVMTDAPLKLRISNAYLPIRRKIVKILKDCDIFDISGTTFKSELNFSSARFCASLKVIFNSVRGEKEVSIKLPTGISNLELINPNPLKNDQPRLKILGWPESMKRILLEGFTLDSDIIEKLNEISINLPFQKISLNSCIIAPKKIKFATNELIIEYCKGQISDLSEIRCNNLTFIRFNNVRGEKEVSIKLPTGISNLELINPNPPKNDQPRLKILGWPESMKRILLEGFTLDSDIIEKLNEISINLPFQKISLNSCIIAPKKIKFATNELIIEYCKVQISDLSEIRCNNLTIMRSLPSESPLKEWVYPETVRTLSLKNVPLGALESVPSAPNLKKLNIEMQPAMRPLFKALKQSLGQGMPVPETLEFLHGISSAPKVTRNYNDVYKLLMNNCVQYRNALMKIKNVNFPLTFCENYLDGFTDTAKRLRPNINPNQIGHYLDALAFSAKILHSQEIIDYLKDIRQSFYEFLDPAIQDRLTSNHVAEEDRVIKDRQNEIIAFIKDFIEINPDNPFNQETAEAFFEGFKRLKQKYHREEDPEIKDSLRNFLKDFEELNINR